jgi:hypothetical protein
MEILVSLMQFSVEWARVGVFSKFWRFGNIRRAFLVSALSAFMSLGKNDFSNFGTLNSHA